MKVGVQRLSLICPQEEVHDQLNTSSADEVNENATTSDANNLEVEESSLVNHVGIPVAKTNPVICHVAKNNPVANIADILAPEENLNETTCENDDIDDKVKEESSTQRVVVKAANEGEEAFNDMKEKK